jgi:branched-chain amino acid transport system permease protein
MASDSVERGAVTAPSPQPEQTVRPAGIKAALRFLPIAAALLLAVLPALRVDSYVVHLALLGMIFCIAATGLTGLLGYCGQYSMAQGAFFGIGAYTAAILTTKAGLPSYATLPFSIVMAGLFGIALGIPSLRLSGHFLAITTVAFQVITSLVIGQWYGLTGGSSGISGIPKMVPSDWLLNVDGQLTSYYVTFVVCVFSVWLVQRLLNSRLGEVWLAIQGDELLAKSLGMNTTLAKLGAFALSAAFAGAAGALLAQYLGSTDPTEYSIWTSVTLLAMLLIGGRQNPYGAALGAAILTLVPELLRSSDEFRLLLYGLIIILVVKFAPFGLLGAGAAKRMTAKT